MRKLIPGLLLPLVWFSFISPVIAAEGSASLPGACVEAPNEGGALREITCRIPPNALGESLRFRARFSGGHDDTEASMELELDALPLQCDPGSKTQLRFEDGNVALHCVFTPRKQSAERVLKVRVLWSHCSYEGFELLAAAVGE